MSSDVDLLVARARMSRDRIDAAQAASDSYRDAVRDLRDHVGAREAARLLGISRQQVYKLTKGTK